MLFSAVWLVLIASLCAHIFAGDLDPLLRHWWGRWVVAIMLTPFMVAVSLYLGVRYAWQFLRYALTFDKYITWQANKAYMKMDLDAVDQFFTRTIPTMIKHGELNW